MDESGIFKGDTMHKWFIYTFLILASACAQNNENLSLNGEKALNLANEIRVVDERGNGIANAKVLVGLSEGAFPNNILTTDQNGNVSIPAGWTAEQPVTIMADNYIRTTYLRQKPAAKVYRVNTFRTVPAQEIKGVTTGYPELKRDDKIDFGLVLPLMPKTAFFQFDLGLFISPDSDVIEIMGNKLNVPSNVSLPDQSERYLFFNIRFNKPIYRTYFHEAGQHELVATRGQFPFKKMLDEFQDGKGFTEVVNLFNFIEGGLHIATAPGNADLAINSFQFQGSHPVKAPQIPTGYSYFASSLQEKNGLLYPADVKRLLSNESMGLKISPLSTKNTLLAAVAKEEKLENGATRLNPAMSISILPFVPGVVQTYLPLIAAPQVNDGLITITAPAAEGFQKVGTYLSLQDVKVEMIEDQYNEQVTKIWEIYSDVWETEIRLPKVQELQIANQLRWESLLLATKASRANATGPAMFDVAEYVTRNATSL
jgi:hypothetical protein